MKESLARLVGAQGVAEPQAVSSQQEQQASSLALAPCPSLGVTRPSPFPHGSCCCVATLGAMDFIPPGLLTPSERERLILCSSPQSRP